MWPPFQGCIVQTEAEISLVTLVDRGRAKSVQVFDILEAETIIACGGEAMSSVIHEPRVMSHR